jgi:hypothetical protein
MVWELLLTHVHVLLMWLLWGVVLRRLALLLAEFLASLMVTLLGVLLVVASFVTSLFLMMFVLMGAFVILPVSIPASIFTLILAITARILATTLSRITFPFVGLLSCLIRALVQIFGRSISYRCHLGIILALVERMLVFSLTKNLHLAEVLSVVLVVHLLGSVFPLFAALESLWAIFLLLFEGELLDLVDLTGIPALGSKPWSL